MAEMADIDAEVAELELRRQWILLRLEGGTVQAQSKRGVGGLEREVMAYLEEHRTACMTDIALNVITTRQSATTVLRKLIERGLVERYARGKYRAVAS